MQPRPGMPESFRDYLRQRWKAGCRHGRTLFAEIRKLTFPGYGKTRKIQNQGTPYNCQPMDGYSAIRAT
jgi:hypothetical protein